MIDKKLIRKLTTKLTLKKSAFWISNLLLILISFNTPAQVIRLGPSIGFGRNTRQLTLELNYASKAKMEVGFYYSEGIKSYFEKSIIFNELLIENIHFRYGIQWKYYFKEKGFKPYAGLQLGLNKEKMLYFSKINGSFMPIEKLLYSTFQATPTAGFSFGPLNVNVNAPYGVHYGTVIVNVGLLFGLGKFK